MVHSSAGRRPPHIPAVDAIAIGRRWLSREHTWQALRTAMRFDRSGQQPHCTDRGRSAHPSELNEALAAKATRRLAQVGVEVLMSTKVERVHANGVLLGGKPIASATVLWTAGVAPAPILKQLRAQSDRAGRIAVGPTLEVLGRRGIFVVGDAAALRQNGRQLPGVALVAIQQENSTE